jgi:hypothetical protein
VTYFIECCEKKTRHRAHHTQLRAFHAPPRYLCTHSCYQRLNGLLTEVESATDSQEGLPCVVGHDDQVVPYLPVGTGEFMTTSSEPTSTSSGGPGSPSPSDYETSASDDSESAGSGGSWSAVDESATSSRDSEMTSAGGSGCADDDLSRGTCHVRCVSYDVGEQMHIDIRSRVNSSTIWSDSLKRIYEVENGDSVDLPVPDILPYRPNI